jgi:alkylation response protein AidB-like acyl-CoA dehydrogenase
MSSPLAGPRVAADLDLATFTSRFDEWLDRAPSALTDATVPQTTTEAHMDAMRRLFSLLYAEGWSRYGWPAEFGGLGGSILHRASMWECLARHGVRGMAGFEHLEVLGPTLLAMAPPAFTAATFPRFLDGTETWCQGFSEPDAGSDLASLRTRAVAVDDGYAINGRKIWTSWAGFATWALVLARTGTVEARHRGITAFIVDLRSPGVTVRRLAQANGGDELAEVTFDDVKVAGSRVVGAEHEGWSVAMHILSHERGTFAWFRQCFLLQALRRQVDLATADSDGLLGDALLDLASVRAISAAALAAHAGEPPLGPRAAFTKVLLCTAEQKLYDWILATDIDLATAPLDPAAAAARADYLFSRIVTIYGGSRQMQLDTVAKQILKLP